MEHRAWYLPQDIWIQILKHFDGEDLEGPSLVSKEFLSITNSLKRSLKIFDGTVPILPNILRRFPHLESITINVKHTNYFDLLHQISKSQHEGMKTLKRLDLRFWDGFEEKDFIALADLFPWLEEICFPSSLNEIISSHKHVCEKVLLKLTALKKVTFGHRLWECFLPSDEAFRLFSLNCVSLEEIVFGRGTIKEETVGFMMRHCTRLTTLEFPHPIESTNPNSSLSIQNTIAYAKNLHFLSFYTDTFPKEAIRPFAQANPPLRKLEIHIYGDETEPDHLLELFQACSSIQDLCLHGSVLPLDRFVKAFSQHLTKLIRVKLSRCFLTIGSFFTLTKCCPFLEVLEMEHMLIRSKKTNSEHLHKHEKLRDMNLSGSRGLNDETLATILRVCPNLQSINLNHCSDVSEKGVSGIIKNCRLLLELKIHGLEIISNVIGKSLEGETIGLKFLEAGETSLNDKALGEIGKVCTNLEYLGIGNCQRVTSTGVFEVMRNCKKLKIVDLNGMLRPRQSIKRLVIPNSFYMSEEHWNFILEHGWKVCAVDTL